MKFHEPQLQSPPRVRRAAARTHVCSDPLLLPTRSPAAVHSATQSPAAIGSGRLATARVTCDTAAGGARVQRRPHDAHAKRVQNRKQSAIRTEMRQQQASHVNQLGRGGNSEPSAAAADGD